ncbi:MAG TPA: MFS transporter [Casimicrobiaceae bacterium]|nr:MFS transporter [Casimicrobiaceae bacterium]
MACYSAMSAGGFFMIISKRNIFLLSCCQGLLLINNAGLIAMNALIGYGLVSNKAFASLGATTYVLGSAVATMPASLWMARVGRRRGFMTGSTLGMLGSLLAVVALWLGSFALFCVATAVIGVYTAFGAQYRFAAAEISPPVFKAKAISLVLAGGIVGGVIGPELSRVARNWFAMPFLGSFAMLSLIAIAALFVQSRVELPKPVPGDHPHGGRPLSEIVRQPVFVVAAMSAALGYGLMNLLMTATPLAMSFCSHPYSAAAMVIEWHVVGMFAPGFFTGGLIARFGVLRVIIAGTLLMVGCVFVALAGNTVVHFIAALMLLGVGWNFMYTGGTTLLTEAYHPVEKAKTQGANEIIVFTVMGVSSFSSGALVSSAGWERMNAAALPVLAVVAIGAFWLMWLRGQSRPVQA